MPLTLDRLFDVQEKTKGPLQTLRDIRRENAADAVTYQTARIQNELRQMQTEETKARADALKAETAEQTAVTGVVQDNLAGNPPANQWASQPKTSSQAASSIAQYAQNPKMLNNIKKTRDMLIQRGSSIALEKAAKLDAIIKTAEDRYDNARTHSYQDRSEARTVADRNRERAQEAARMWAATPDSEKSARFEPFKKKYGLGDISTIDGLDRWSRDRMAEAKDIKFGQGGGYKTSDSNNDLTNSKKIRENFDSEMQRKYKITKDKDGVLQVDGSYDQVRRTYAAAVDSQGSSYNAYELFKQVTDNFVHVKSPQSKYNDGLSDMTQDVFVPREWMGAAMQTNPELTEGQVAIIYSMIVNDIQQYGYVSPETDAVVQKNGLGKTNE